MGICAACIGRDGHSQSATQKGNTFEIQPIEFGTFVDEGNAFATEKCIPEREEKEKSHKFSAPVDLDDKNKTREEEEKSKGIQNAERKKAKSCCIIKKERKKSQRWNLCVKKRLKKRERKRKGKETWKSEDELIFREILKKHEGDYIEVLTKHFHSKLPLLNLRLISLELEHSKSKINPEAFKQDYSHFRGNWELLSEKYGFSQKVLKSYFYGYVFHSFLDSDKFKTTIPDTIESSENEDHKVFFFEGKENGSPGLSLSKKGEVASMSDLNDEALVEEKISYLSARKEILESLNNYLIEGGSEQEEGDL